MAYFDRYVSILRKILPPYAKDRKIHGFGQIYVLSSKQGEENEFGGFDTFLCPVLLYGPWELV